MFVYVCVCVYYLGGRCEKYLAWFGYLFIGEKKERRAVTACVRAAGLNLTMKTNRRFILFEQLQKVIAM